MSMAIGAAASQPQKKWTILYYFDGKNNLAPMAEHSFNSLDQVGSDDNVNLVAQFGMPKKNVLQGLIEKGGGTAVFQDIGDRDMGSADNVKQFVEWGMKNYPAEHYALVMWDHGAGFEGSMVDEETNHIITNNQLAKALEDAAKETGKKLDVINWNACLMQQAETGYELRNAASYMVGSEEVEAGLRIPIPGVFGTTPQHEIAKDVKEAVKTKGDLTPEEVAKLFVFEAKNQFGGSMFTPTQSAIDLSKMEKVTKQLDNLAGALLDTIKADPSTLDKVRSDVKKAQHFLAADMYIEPYVDYRDIGDFCRVLVKDTKLNAVNPQVGEAAKQVMASLQEAVIAEHHAPISSMGGRSLEGATGMSIYLPTDYGFDKVSHSSIDGIPQEGTHGHENTSLAKDTKWDTLLKTISKDDDWKGKMPGQRALMSFGQIAAYYGYQYAYQAIGGTTAATWNIFPLMGAPYFLPLPGVVAAGMGAVGGALKVDKGISKMVESFERRDDSPMSHRLELGIQGAVDTAVGIGSIGVCGLMGANSAVSLAGMVAGLGASGLAHLGVAAGTAASLSAFAASAGTLASHITSPLLVPVAAGVLALGVGRMAVGLARNYSKMHQQQKMTIDDKLANIPSSPSFSALSNGGKLVHTAPAAKAQPQPVLQPPTVVAK